MAKSLRFIHCGDLHLGSPFHDIAMVDERWQRIVGKAPVRAFQKIVQTAIDKEVDAVLIAGDVYTSASCTSWPSTIYRSLPYWAITTRWMPGRHGFPFRPTYMFLARKRSNGSPSS